MTHLLRPERQRITAILILTFLPLALFAILATVETQQLASKAWDSVQQSDHYQAARYQVGAEESLERKYRLEPSAAVLQRHTDAGAALVAILTTLRSEVAPDEQRQIDGTLRLHKQYLDAVYTQLFPAVDAHDLARQTAVDTGLIDPMFDMLQEEVNKASVAHNEVAKQHVRQLMWIQKALVAVTPLVFILGLCVMCYFWLKFQQQQTRLDEVTSQAMAHLKTEATTDSLTALGNHRAFQEALGEMMRRMTSGGQGFTLARLDIDEFKLINDRYGHLRGDQTLIDFGQILTAQFPGHAYRVGGDEFALLMPGDEDQAMPLLNSLSATLRHEQLPTLSVGLMSASQAISSPDDLQQQADQALYEAKRQGRDRIVAFQSIADRATLTGHDQVVSFRNLLTAGHMDIAFQPIWCCPPDDQSAVTLLGFEALARPAPGSGFAGPQELFDLAARLNRSLALDDLCWSSTLKRCHGLPAGSLLFLNLTPQTLDQETPLAPRLLAAAHAAGLHPSQIVLEVTERSVGHMSAVLHQAKLLRDAGFQLALDDVGAGNAGLEMLRQFHVDFVKIDRSVVSAAPMDTVANGVLAAIMAYARVTGVRVIIEGIETADMLRNGTSMGAEAAHGHLLAAQGYLLGRPGKNFDVMPPILDTFTQ